MTSKSVFDSDPRHYVLSLSMCFKVTVFYSMVVLLFVFAEGDSSIKFYGNGYGKIATCI